MNVNITKGVTPIVLAAGDYCNLVADSLCSGSIAIPGEGIAQPITAGSSYGYGGYSVQREVVLSLSSGSISVEVGQTPASMITPAGAATLQSLASGYENAPATLDGTNGDRYNGRTVALAAGATLTVTDAAWSLLGAGVVILVAQSGAATLAFSGTATKENATGTSAANVTLVASGMYTLTQSPGGSPKFRLAGGASL